MSCSSLSARIGQRRGRVDEGTAASHHQPGVGLLQLPHQPLNVPISISFRRIPGVGGVHC
jgi:hypothetical protein